MRNLLVTGTAGFIGINFAKYLVKDPKGILNIYDKVYFIDKMGYATKYNVEEYNKIKQNERISFIDKNINEITDSWFNIPTSWDILNFASESHVDNSLTKPFDIFEENSKIPVSICKLIGIENINHFYHASTDEVYGELPLTNKFEDFNWFSKNSNMKPNNPYSASKAAQDCFLMSIQHTYGMGLTLFRMANQFGGFQHPEKMLPASILRAIKGETIKIYGEGKNIRQWTPVVDTVEYIYDMLCNERKDKIIHFAHRCKILLDNNQVVKLWTKILKEDHNIDAEIEYIDDRLGHDTMYALKDGAEGNQYLEPIESRFRDTIRFYIENKELYLG